MRTEAEVFCKNGVKLTADREAEFLERIKLLFGSGGMMGLKQEELCGREVTVMCRPERTADGIEVCYNYFEDGRQDRAGYSSRSGNIYSGRLGWRQFYQVMAAAYVLESLYLAQPSAAWLNGAWVTNEKYTGWINQLFDAHFSRGNRDPWPLFALLHEQGEPDLNLYDWLVWVQDFVGLIGYYEIRSVLSGTTVAAAEFSPLLAKLGLTEHPPKGEAHKLDFFDCVERVHAAVMQYHQRSRKDQKEQLSRIVALLRSDELQTEANTLDCDDGEEEHLKANALDCDDGEEHLKAIGFFAGLSDAPAYVLKVVSEIYGVEFWPLWDRVKDVAGRRFYTEEAAALPQVEPVSTMDFLQISADDWMLFAGIGEKERFSPALQEWFATLSQRYHTILCKGISGQGMGEAQAFEWIVNLLEYAEQHYYQIYPFAEFLSETQAHLSDRQFWAVWKLFEELMHDPKMKADARVIFAAEPLNDLLSRNGFRESQTSDGVKTERHGALRPMRRLKREWELLPTAERNNAARVTLRRYMALLANGRLRRSVFGF